MKRLGLIAFILVVIYFIFIIRQDIMDNAELRREAQGVTKKMAEEEKTALGFKDRQRRMQSGEMVEELARTRLGLIKKGETAYKVVR